MLEPLRNTTYRRLFAAQLIALFGTGLATVALALLAYDLAEERAGAVLGTALAIKMIAYVSIAPLAGAIADRVPRRGLLIGLDLVRAGVVVMLPLVTEIWQVYVLILLLQSASAAFTPTFQATIPQVLPEERTYTKALSLSRLCYDLENLLSPALAAALLLVTTFHSLFAGTVIGFLVSATLIASTHLPAAKPSSDRRGFLARTTLGSRIFFKTPRLRGLMALNMAVAAGGAMALVNTVVYVRSRLELGDSEVAIAMAAFGAGSMVVALALPRLLDRFSDRSVMHIGALLMTVILLGGVAGPGFVGLLALWLALGAGYSMVLTPTGRLLRRSAPDEDRPAVFAAQFSLSHACWLVTYPLAGWAGAAFTLEAAFISLALLAAMGSLTAWRLWPGESSQ